VRAKNTVLHRNFSRSAFMPVGSRVPFEGIDHDDAHLGFSLLPQQHGAAIGWTGLLETCPADPATLKIDSGGFLQDPGEALLIASAVSVATFCERLPKSCSART